MKQLEGRDFLREKIRERDNWTCQICGKIWNKKTRRLDVHHLDLELEGYNGSKYRANLQFDKMITLCHKCHLTLYHIKDKMRKKASRKIDWDKFKTIKELRERGKTFQEIGSILKVSRQRVHQIYKNISTDKRKQLHLISLN